MRLVKTDPGEYVDRQTVLELKIDNADVEFEGDKEVTPSSLAADYRYSRKVVHNPSKINVGPFFDELELIRDKMLKFWIPDIMNNDGKIAEYDRLYEELKNTNGELWDLENKARVLRAAPDKFKEEANKQAAEVLFGITEFNDKRMELVKAINALWGIKGTEKFYD